MGEHNVPQAKDKTSNRSGDNLQSGGQMKQHKLMGTKVKKGEGADKQKKDKEIVEVNSQEEEGERLSRLDFGGDTDDSDDFQSQVLKIQWFQEGGSSQTSSWLQRCTHSNILGVQRKKLLERQNELMRKSSTKLLELLNAQEVGREDEKIYNDEANEANAQSGGSDPKMRGGG
jgi:hypothetical protein